VTVSAATTLTSTLAGTVTLPGAGGTVALAANQAVTIPAGSSIAFSGSSAGTLNVTGAGSLTLKGAGTLALANATVAGSGGSITTNSGTTSFTSGGLLSSLTAGSQINVVGSGTIKLVGTSDGSSSTALPVILPSATDFTTTGAVLSTQGYNIPGSWTNIGALSQSTGDGLTTVTITQTAAQALLNWTTFNIGKNTLLDFDQSAGGANVGNWIALNRILDPSLAPSQILGHIEAPGQVYVINQNGILFGGSSQVDTHALVASTLPINSNLVSAGLLNNPSAQFLFSSLAIPSLQGSSSYDPNSDPNALSGVTSGNITVQAGAEISTPTTSEHVGGKIALIAPNVDNEGTLSSPDGQVILAAGQQVGFAAHPSSDPSLRGLDVAIGAGSGTASNGVNGYIDAPRADVTIAGATVNQLGVINSTTSVA
jgi:filamentous hemagglutinin family protein